LKGVEHNQHAPRRYEINWAFSNSISSWGHKLNVLGDGNCLLYAFQYGLLDAYPDYCAEDCLRTSLFGEPENFRCGTNRDYGPSLTTQILGVKFLALDFDHREDNLESTPFKIELWKYNDLCLYDNAVEDGRLTCHIDGSKSNTKWGVVLKDGECVQVWRVLMSASFLIKSGSEYGKAVQKNVSMKLLFEFHSNRTNAEDLAGPIRKFFYLAQQKYCGRVQYPMLFKMDNAYQMQSAILDED
jgi:hypothetical protein